MLDALKETILAEFPTRTSVSFIQLYVLFPRIDGRLGIIVLLFTRFLLTFQGSDLLIDALPSILNALCASPKGAVFLHVFKGINCLGSAAGAIQRLLTGIIFGKEIILHGHHFLCHGRKKLHICHLRHPCLILVERLQHDPPIVDRVNEESIVVHRLGVRRGIAVKQHIPLADTDLVLEFNISSL